MWRRTSAAGVATRLISTPLGDSIKSKQAFCTSFDTLNLSILLPTGISKASSGCNQSTKLASRSNHQTMKQPRASESNACAAIP